VVGEGRVCVPRGAAGAESGGDAAPTSRTLPAQIQPRAPSTSTRYHVVLPPTPGPAPKPTIVTVVPGVSSAITPVFPVDGMLRKRPPSPVTSPRVAAGVAVSAGRDAGAWRAPAVGCRVATSVAGSTATAATAVAVGAAWPASRFANPSARARPTTTTPATR